MREGSVSSPRTAQAEPNPDSRGAAVANRAALVVDVNGEARTLADPCSVAGLLETLGLAGKRVAVAVNREVVLRSQYAGFALTNGDRIEILEAVGGG